MDLLTELQELSKQAIFEQEQIRLKQEKQSEIETEAFFNNILIPYLKEVAQMGKTYIGFYLYYKEDRVWRIEFWPDTLPPSREQANGALILTEFHTSLQMLDKILKSKNFCQCFVQLNYHNKKENMGTYACLINWNPDIIYTLDSEKTGSLDKCIQISSNQIQAKIERSKLTPGLRYDILCRDDFRCQICGRSQKDGVKLHVDHIIPVSKGGLTTWDNLRTLCQECNLGKSNKIEKIN